MTNSRNDLVGRDQLCITDHVSPSVGIGGRESQSFLIPYIFLKASENADLQAQPWGQQMANKAPRHMILGTARGLTYNYQHLQHHKMTKNLGSRDF